MKTLQAVIFDYGNVLCEPQRQSDLVAMAHACRLPLDTFQDNYWRFRDAYDKGHIHAREYWNLIAKTAGVALREEQLTEAIAIDNESWSRQNKTMSAWAALLHALGLRTAILSNMPLELKTHIEANCNWLPDFNHRIYSCDTGNIKPDLAIYSHCLALLEVAPAQALFIDDREANVRAGEKLGVNGVIFSTLDLAAEELSARFELPHLKSCVAGASDATTLA